MQEAEELTDDYTRGQVPESATVSGLRIAIVMGGAIITLPVFLVGAELGHNFGFFRAMIVFFSAGLVLALIAGATGVLASRCRLTTWLIIQFSFGRVGAKFVAGFVGITVLGWYGATVDMFARAVQNMLASLGFDGLSREVYLVGASILMVCVAMFGFKGLERLSRPAVPVMIVLLALMIYSSISVYGLPDTIGSDMTIAQGISAGIGGFIVAVIMFPDMCRYARSSGDAVMASGASFGINIPVILTLAAVPSIATGEQEFLKAILLVGFGTLSLALLLLATWTTNVYNLYSISLVMASIVNNIVQWKLVIVAGVAGTVVALLPILDNFLQFLNFLAAAVPPIGGIYLADFYFGQRDYSEDTLRTADKFGVAAFVSWGVGSAVGYLSNTGALTLTTVAAIDALMCAMLTYVLLGYARKTIVVTT